MNAVEDFRAEIAGLEGLSLRRRPPAEVQLGTASRLAGAFRKMSKSEREVASAALVNTSVGMKLLGLSGYLAETAINQNDPSVLRDALTLHIIEGFRTDYRENIRCLVLIGYAATKLKVRLDALVTAVSDLASAHARQSFYDFCHREFMLNQLESFEIRADDVPGAFRFVPVPGRW